MEKLERLTALQAIGLVLFTGVFFTALIIASEFKQQASEKDRPFRAPLYKISEARLAEIKDYYSQHPSKPKYWGVSVTGDGRDASVSFISPYKLEAWEAKINVGHLCPPDDEAVWRGLNQNNTLHLRVEVVLIGEVMARRTCDGPTRTAAYYAGTKTQQSTTDISGTTLY